VIDWTLGSLVGLMGFGFVNIPCVGEWCKMGLPAINAMLTTLVVYVILGANFGRKVKHN
jgi:hypothetical protein